MRDLPLNGSRRKRFTDAGTSASREGTGGIVPTAIALILILALAIWVIAPGQVDEALGRTASAVTDKNAITTQVWRTVASTFEGEDSEPVQVASAAPLSGVATIKPNESISTGSTGRTVLTRGHDIVDLAPRTTIVVDERGSEDPATIIRLIDGTLHVRAAKRPVRGTLSVETRYLVATVKGTKFDVTTTAGGASVSVTEGIVRVRTIGSSEGVDLTRGRTAIVLAGEGATLRVISTPPGGGLAGIEAIGAGTISNSNHHQR